MPTGSNNAKSSQVVVRVPHDAKGRLMAIAATRNPPISIARAINEAIVMWCDTAEEPAQ